MFALGTSVAYTHRAGVARKREGKWYLPAKGNGEIPGTQQVGNGVAVSELGVLAEHIEPVTKSKWARSEESIARRNKSVLSWPQEGSGVIVGLQTKQVGVSEAGGPSFSSDDYDPGYFTSHGNVDLYVVRSELRGKRFVYVPTWAVRAL